MILLVEPRGACDAPIRVPITCQSENCRISVFRPLSCNTQTAQQGPSRHPSMGPLRRWVYLLLVVLLALTCLPGMAVRRDLLADLWCLNAERTPKLKQWRSALQAVAQMTGTSLKFWIPPLLMRASALDTGQRLTPPKQQLSRKQHHLQFPAFARPPPCSSDPLAGVPEEPSQTAAPAGMPSEAGQSAFSSRRR